MSTADKRLVKVALPGHLVDAMDQMILSSEVYRGRQEFVGDAIANLIADLQVDRDAPQFGTGQLAEASLPAASDARSAPMQGRTSPDAEAVVNQSRLSRTLVEPLSRGEAEAAITLASLDTSTCVEDLVPSPTTVPTWGLHNRDFPTLWAAFHLGRASGSEPIEFRAFVDELAELAWRVTHTLSGHREWDLAGFPANPKKADQSEARFREFFVGGDSGSGPLFDFGLAVVVEGERACLSRDGLALLRELSGLRPGREDTVGSDHRIAFLHHIAKWVPADFEMLVEVMSHIESGAATRLELIEAIGSAHADWSESTVATNAAGYVARAREWGLIDRKQVNHRYVITRKGEADLRSVVSAVSGVVRLSRGIGSTAGGVR